MEDVSHESTFGFLPDLIIGLTGIPTGLAIQTLAEKIAPKLSETNPLWAPDWALEGVRVFCLIVGFYGLCSAAVLLSVELLKRRTASNAILWQKSLAVMSLIYIPYIMIMIGTVSLLGASYEPGIWNEIEQALAVMVLAGITVGPFLVLGTQQWNQWFQLISDQFPHLLPGYSLVTIVMWIITYPLTFFAQR